MIVPPAFDNVASQFDVFGSIELVSNTNFPQDYHQSLTFQWVETQHLFATEIIICLMN